jgi:exonuclease SbcC
MTQADEIEHGARALRHWRETVATFAAAVRQVNQQIAIQNDAEREIDGELARLLQERERRAQLAHSTGERLRKLERDAEQLDALQRETDLAASELARLPSTRAAIEQLTGERSELHAGNATLKARMQEIKDNLSRLQAGDADCPVCRRPLVPVDRTRIADAWTSDGRLLGDQYRTNQQHMAELDARVRALNDDQARLVDIDRQNVARERQMQILETGLSDRDRMQAERDAATCEVERIDAVVAGGAFAHDARRRLHAAEETLAALNYDGAAHDAATAAERRYAAFEERKRDLDQARARLDGVEQAIASIVAQQDERGEAHDQARQEVVDFEAQLGSDPNLRARAQEAADDAEQLADEKHRLSGDLGGIERRLAHLDELQSERDELSRQSAALALDHGALRELVEAFGRNGIQAMIVDSVLPELEDETNTLLRRMSSGELSVAFRSQRQLISRDEVSETLDILIRDELGERSYALYSGGEAFRVNFAVRVALSKLLARRAGATIDLLVIDEGFGTQDSRGRDGLIEALRSVENDFRTILVITHIGEIRELFPTRIDIVKTERGSQISVN